MSDAFNLVIAIAVILGQAYANVSLRDQAIARGYAEWCGGVPQTWAWKGECRKGEK